MVAVLTASLFAACGSAPAPASPTTSRGPAPDASAFVSAAASPSSTATGDTVFDTATIPTKFALPMTIAVPDGWRPLTDVPGVLTMIHVGSPAEDESKWWGPDIALVDGARVVDPARILQPAADGDASEPWPDDFVAYLTSVPGTRIVSGPEPVTIGGATGTRLILDTPPMHPVVWLKDDTAWMGGGDAGLDPALRRLVILIDVGQKHVLFQQADRPEAFAEHLPMVESLVATMRFGTD
jgi:hypothetical protein